MPNPTPQPDPSPVTPAWPALLAAPAVARYLGLSTRTVWRSAATGELPRPVKLGGRTLWKKTEIDAVIGELKAEK